MSPPACCGSRSMTMLSRCNVRAWASCATVSPKSYDPGALLGTTGPPKKDGRDTSDRQHDATDGVADRNRIAEDAIRDHGDERGPQPETEQDVAEGDEPHADAAMFVRHQCLQSRHAADRTERREQRPQTEAEQRAIA